MSNKNWRQSYVGFILIVDKMERIIVVNLSWIRDYSAYGISLFEVVILPSEISTIHIHILLIRVRMGHVDDGDGLRFQGLGRIVHGLDCDLCFVIGQEGVSLLFQ